mmetsp:Transcript_24757/g.65097  ORF Transcript_24757/g.65097 Transcript_24757/m.65097 type:complete len:247 (-) Transcript_24757:830-1570(-)
MVYGRLWQFEGNFRLLRFDSIFDFLLHCRFRNPQRSYAHVVDDNIFAGNGESMLSQVFVRKCAHGIVAFLPADHDAKICSLIPHIQIPLRCDVVLLNALGQKITDGFILQFHETTFRRLEHRSITDDHSKWLLLLRDNVGNANTVRRQNARVLRNVNRLHTQSARHVARMLPPRAPKARQHVPADVEALALRQVPDRPTHRLVGHGDEPERDLLRAHRLVPGRVLNHEPIDLLRHLLKLRTRRFLI